MDLTSRLRSIVRGGGADRSAASLDPAKPRRELTYEPDNGGYRATLDLERVGEMLGGRPVSTPYGQCLVIDRRYEADRFHGDIRIEECEIRDTEGLRLLDPLLEFSGTDVSGSPRLGRTIFLDLETTGLSGGAGTIAFLVGCGYFDLGAFQVRQFLLASHASERALLAAVAEFFEGADLIVTYNGKTFDLPVMETRWLFHRITPPLEGVPHFDMVHPARRLWRHRSRSHSTTRVGPPFRAGVFEEPQRSDATCCRLSTLERLLFDVTRVGDVPGLEIPGRFFGFVRSGDPRPLEPVLEHNRLDLVSLAAVTARAARLAQQGHEACRDCSEALALGRVYERAGSFERAEACFRGAAASDAPEVKAEALYRLALRFRRDRRYEEAASIWRDVLAWTERTRGKRSLVELRQVAAEALAIHLEHRRRDLDGARTHALFALDQSDVRRLDNVRHRLARIDRKLSKKKNPGYEDPGLLPLQL
jgi:uncharacterized protein YprB with RNaseH-like and TPR domain